jgi:hypothetical protein
MRVILFGATGMIGKGVLRECLLDPGVVPPGVHMWPFMPLVAALAPRYVTTTERVGRAMLNVARRGAAKAVLENDDINQAANEAPWR